MTIRAVDLPELRSRLAATRHSKFEEANWAATVATAEPCWRDDGFDRNFIEQAKWDALDHADLFYVAPNMGELAQVAAETMPEFDVQLDDLPSPRGLILFGGSLPAFVDTTWPENCLCGSPHNNHYAGVAWAPAVRPDGGTSFLLFPIFDRHATAAAKGREPQPGVDRFYIAGAMAVPHNCRHQGGGSDLTNGMFRVLRTVSMLMQQPLAQSSDEQIDRAARKRLARAGYTPKPIRVIELRRPRSTGGSADSAGSYHHQWIVRGHWRNHWHPKRQVHRPVWIAPHVKGPEGAPMLGGEKVYALKR